MASEEFLIDLFNDPNVQRTFQVSLRRPWRYLDVIDVLFPQFFIPKLLRGRETVVDSAVRAYIVLIISHLPACKYSCTGFLMPGPGRARHMGACLGKGEIGQQRGGAGNSHEDGFV